MTKTVLASIVLLSLGLLVAACEDHSETGGASASGTLADEAAPADFSHSVFVLDKNVTVREVIGASFGHPLALTAGTALVVIESKHDPQMGEIVHLGFDTDESGVPPNDVWVKNSPEFDQSLSTPYEIAAGTYCFRYVKLYLLHTGQVRTYLPGTYAAQAFYILPRYGFHVTGHSPAQARVGEVCVYSGGPRGYGHIEVRRARGWWYGYGFFRHPIRDRRFLACFKK